MITEPVKALISNCQSVSCGIEFTIWLCDGNIYGAGLPQYGQLGDGTDHEYNAKEGKAPAMLVLSSSGERSWVTDIVLWP